MNVIQIGVHQVDIFSRKLISLILSEEDLNTYPSQLEINGKTSVGRLLSPYRFVVASFPREEHMRNKRKYRRTWKKDRSTSSPDES